MLLVCFVILFSYPTITDREYMSGHVRMDGTRVPKIGGDSHNKLVPTTLGGICFHFRYEYKIMFSREGAGGRITLSTLMMKGWQSPSLRGTWPCWVWTPIRVFLQWIPPTDRGHDGMVPVQCTSVCSITTKWPWPNATKKDAGILVICWVYISKGYFDTNLPTDSHAFTRASKITKPPCPL